MQQMERGEITAVEAKTTMQGLEQMSHLFEQRVQQHGSQQAPEAPLPEFMRIEIEGRNEERAQRRAKERAEKEAIEGGAASPSKGDP